MSNVRTSPTENDHINLVSMVRGFCPLCNKSLFHTKGKRKFKSYEIAHIYPLNPLPAELIDLANVEKLFISDPNEDENLIPLCIMCHGQFDNPRTREEYETLYSIKKRIIHEMNQRETFARYTLHEEIAKVIDSFQNISSNPSIQEITYDPKTIEEKMDQTMSPITKRRIVRDVEDYFCFVKSNLANLDRIAPGVPTLISSQIKAFYKQQKVLVNDQNLIFKAVVDWIKFHTKSINSDAPEVVASFFVQNCEVFE